MDFPGQYQDAFPGMAISKRKREPYDYRDVYQSASSGKRRKRDGIAEFPNCSAQQQSIFQKNSISSHLLRLPAEVRNEIYGFVLSNQVIHISVRDCPRFDRASFTHTEYYCPHRKARAGNHAVESSALLKFTHTICTLPCDEEDKAYTLAKSKNAKNPISPVEEGRTSYRIRHKPCYRAIAQLKGNWDRTGNDVAVSPFFKEVKTPQLAVNFLQVCRQIYSEARDLLYATNTFTFHEGRTLELFLSKCLTLPQCHLITRIQLDGWMYADYDPGFNPRTAILQRLTGLKSIDIATLDAYTTQCQSRLAFGDYMGGSINKREDHTGSKDIVRVTIDQADKGFYNALELERLVKKNAEMAFGYHDLCCVQENKPFSLQVDQY